MRISYLFEVKMMLAFSVVMVMYCNSSSPVAIRNSRYLVIPESSRYLLIWKPSQNKTLTCDLNKNDFTNMEIETPKYITPYCCYCRERIFASLLHRM